MGRARSRRAGALAAAAAAALAAAWAGPASAHDRGHAPAPTAAARAAKALALAPPGGDGPVDRGVARLQAAARRAPSAEAWITLGHAWVQKARTAAEPRFHRNAGACATLALALEPGSPGAHGLRGMVHLDRHRFAEAAREAAAALRRAPDDLAALGVLADALVELGRYDEAERTTARLMALKPALPAYGRASYLLWLRGEDAPALEAIRRGIDAAGGGGGEPRAWALVQAAQIFWHRGDLEGAGAGFGVALEVLPGFPPALVGSGRVALARGDAARAVRLLEEAWRRSPHAETAWLLGDARRAAGDARGAEAAYREVERLGRRGEERVLALFLATHRRGPPAEAVRLAAREHRRRPDVYGDDALAWALHRAGRHVEARAASDRALRLGTPDARLLFHAGAIRLALGEREAGERLVRRALALNPHFDPTEAAEAARLAGELSAPRRAGTAAARSARSPRTAAAPRAR